MFRNRTFDHVDGVARERRRVWHWRIGPHSGAHTAEPDPAAATGGRQGGRGNQPAAPRPYIQVITNAAKTDEGIFKVHRIGDTFYYEIPKAQLDKDFSGSRQIKKTTIGAGYGGQAAGSRVVALDACRAIASCSTNIDYSVVADPLNPIAAGGRGFQQPDDHSRVPVAAYAPSADPVIDVTSLFMSDVAEFSVRGRIGGRGYDATRSFLEKAVSFPRTSTSSHADVHRRRRDTPRRRAAGGRAARAAPPACAAAARPC
jgi:hypothetical protein